MWEAHGEFFPLIERVWQSLGKAESIQDTSDKLRDLAKALADWGRNNFGQVRSELRTLKRRLEELRSEPNRQGPSYEELKVQNRIVEINYREEVMWRQR